LLKSRLFKYYLFAAALLFLLVGVSLNLFFKSQDLNKEEYLNTVQSRISSEVVSLQKQLVNVIEYVELNQNINFSELNISTDYPFYIYHNGKLVFWSDFRFVPSYRQLKGNYRIKFVRTIRKDFLSRRWSVSGTDYEIFALIPIYNNYKVDNNYVSSGFNPKLFSDQELIIYTLEDPNGTEVCLEESNNCYFKVDFEPNYVQNRVFVNVLILTLISIGICLFIIWAYSFATYVLDKQVEKGFLLIAAVLVIIRWLMLTFNFPGDFISSNLFSSKVFASSVVSPSLGDLFLNVLFVLLLAGYAFSNYYRSSFAKEIIKNVKFNTVISVILGGLLPLLVHLVFLTFQTIYHNSQLTFDINQSITFSTERILLFGIFLILSASVFFVNHLLFNLLRKASGKKRYFIVYYLIGCLLFVLINIAFGQRFFDSLIISFIWVAILLTTRLSGYLSRVRYNTFLYFFSGIIVLALIGSLSIHRFEKERELGRKQKFATQFLIENDNLAEYLLSEVNKKIKSDVFIQSRMASPFLSKEIIKSKIKQVYLNNYFDKYEINIYLYNSNREPFEPEEETLNPEEIKAFNIEKYKTNYDGIYYINKLGAELTKRYLDFIEIKKRGITVGYLIIDLNLKRIIPENVYPELLVDNAFLFPFQDANYSYAVLADKKIVYSSGNFNYITGFDVQLLEEENLYEDGLTFHEYSHLALKDADGRVIIISSNLHPWPNVISNFSFLFLIQVFVLLILTILYAMYFSFQNVSLNYSARIQLYLNVAFFMPLFAVSITTLSLINSSFRKEINEEYYQKARSISANISDDLDSYIKADEVDDEELPNKLAQVAKFSGADVNLFNVKGSLLTTSQPLIYENELLSNNINPKALANIREKGESVFIATESVGSLKYNTTYYSVKSFASGKLIGILSIPFFQSEYALEQNQIEVLSNVINIFTIIFIVFLLISYLAAKWLTFPLSFITQKLKKTTLTGFNEPLTWKSDDEIGLMVGEYNRMLVNLEESKKALARTEKESAWREIAQQVAHEIKNPLTPMKLTLQHLSRKLLNSPDKEELNKPVNTLLHEIETLNDIASSFSSFAKLPIPEHERYAFVPVVKKSVALYGATKDASISLQLPDEEVYTVGDEQLMGRIISNIIINAIQASDGKRNIDVILEVSERNRLLLEVRDDGPGIDESLRSKIFLPNFSTKDTGSGIGLAIAKHGVEHAGGKIWYETETSKGTSFYIELPMVE